MYSQLRSVPLLLVIAGVALAQTPSPAKVAIINAQKAVADTQEIKKAQTALEAKYRTRQQSIQNLQTDLEGIQKQLSTPNLPPERDGLLRQQGTVKQKELQRLSEDLQ